MLEKDAALSCSGSDSSGGRIGARQRAACNVHHATRNMQHAACNMMRHFVCTEVTQSDGSGAHYRAALTREG
jgi:hypothetical protein